MIKLIIENINQIDSVAEDFLNNIGDKKIIAFYGHMGAGKTTFIKSICEKLGTKDIVVSPTFAIINEYEVKDSDSIFHFDMYRIEKIEDAINIGIFEYFESGNYCFIEWPEMIEDILPENCLKVKIFENKGKRILKFTNY